MSNQRAERHCFTSPSPSAGVVPEFIEGSRWFIYHIEAGVDGARRYRGIVCFERQKRVSVLEKKYLTVTFEPYRGRSVDAFDWLSGYEAVAGPFHRDVPVPGVHRVSRFTEPMRALDVGEEVDDIIKQYPHMIAHRRSMLAYQREMQRREDLVNVRRLVTSDISDATDSEAL